MPDSNKWELASIWLLYFQVGNHLIWHLFHSPCARDRESEAQSYSQGCADGQLQRWAWMHCSAWVVCRAPRCLDVDCPDQVCHLPVHPLLSRDVHTAWPLGPEALRRDLFSGMQCAVLISFVVVQSLSCVWLFATPWIAAHQTSLCYIPEFAQTHVHWVSDVIQPSHPLSCCTPLALNLSQHQSLFQWVSSSHQVTNVSELHLQHQFIQWIFRVDFL